MISKNSTFLKKKKTNCSGSQDIEIIRSSELILPARSCDPQILPPILRFSDPQILRSCLREPQIPTSKKKSHLTVYVDVVH